MEESKVGKLQTLAGSYSILRLNPEAVVPNWVLQCSFYSITKTDDEVSILCRSNEIQAGDFKREDQWRGFRFAGTLDFSMTGVLNSITAPLALAKISLFALSTYDTDYIFIKEAQFQKALEILKQHHFEMI